MKQKIEIKISDVLHLAADNYLHSCSNGGFGINRYSCLAIQDALRKLLSGAVKNNDTEYFIEYQEYSKIIEQGLINMGLENSSSLTAFREFESPCHEPTEQSQGARYAWLKFCALMAEEQGV